MTAPAAEPPRIAPGLRGNANWRRLWLAQAISLTGDSVFDVTIMLWVAVSLAKGRPWAPAAASGVLIAAAASVLAVGPVARVWIDRWDKRRIMMTADACRAAVIASLLVLALAGLSLPLSADLIIVCAVVAAESALAQLFNPARLALLGLIIAPADRPRASGQLQATTSAASIIGPPIAAPMLYALGIRWAIIIDAASFAVSFAAIRAIRGLLRRRVRGSGHSPAGRCSASELRGTSADVPRPGLARVRLADSCFRVSPPAACPCPGPSQMSDCNPTWLN